MKPASAPSLFALAVLVLAILALTTGATQAYKPLHSTYVTAGEVVLQRVLPPPPAPESEQGREDLAAVQSAVARRTPADEARITANLPTTAGQFADVLGPDFSEAKASLTFALVQRAFEDDELIVLAAKKVLHRARPYTLDPDLATYGHRSSSGAYPSGHATFGRLAAIILAAMVPEKAAALFTRGDTYPLNRELAGTHFPTDITAGQVAGSVIAEALFRNPQFQHDFAAARAETRKVLGLP